MKKNPLLPVVIRSPHPKQMGNDNQQSVHGGHDRRRERIPPPDHEDMLYVEYLSKFFSTKLHTTSGERAKANATTP